MRKQSRVIYRFSGRHCFSCKMTNDSIMTLAELRTFRMPPRNHQDACEFPRSFRWQRVFSGENILGRKILTRHWLRNEPAPLFSISPLYEGRNDWTISTTVQVRYGTVHLRSAKTWPRKNKECGCARCVAPQKSCIPKGDPTQDFRGSSSLFFVLFCVPYTCVRALPACRIPVLYKAVTCNELITYWSKNQ